MANAPAGVNDFVYPGAIEQRENDAIEEAIQSANRGGISNPIARDILPEIDLDAGEDLDEETWNDDPQWIQFTGATDAGDYEIYEIDSDTGKMDDRVMAVYGFEVVEGGEYVNVVRFRGSDGQIFERAHIQGLNEAGDTEVDRQATLRSPVLFDAQDNGTIEFEVEEIDAEGEVRVKLLGVTAEKLGRRVGTRQ